MHGGALEDNRRQARVYMRLKRFAVGRRCVILAFMLAAIHLPGRQSRAVAHRMFGNMTYFTNSPEIAEKATLVDGEGAVWNGSLHASLYYAGRYVYGDFNRDGRKDAAVIIGESQGGSDDEVELAFLIYDGTRLVHRQSVYLGDSAIINALKQRSGKVIVDMRIHQQGDCQAGPTKRVRNVYDYLNPTADIRGDHHISVKDGVEEILNLQPKGGKAKPYQVRQGRKVIVRYRLGGEEHA